MPTVTIDGRAVEVEPGTNLIEAARQVGVQIPHYCYHPRLTAVGQCRMCLVKLEGVPKLQAACTTVVTKDGMAVLVDDDEVREAQEGMMEFLLINHPLDCPICDQAGECGLQDYSFKHGQAFSRFAFEDKRTYPGRERIPLGPTVVLNMNRCIRFTEEITKTGELGFFQRGARTEIGVFPGRELDNPLSTCVVDICPVGALTSSEFRFAERVWYLDKEPSLCAGCDAGCNITVEHRRGSIKRFKPRFNAAVNDYWMCDYGRGTFRRYREAQRLGAPLVRSAEGKASVVAWNRALDAVQEKMERGRGGAQAFLGSGFLTTEEAFLLGRLAAQVPTSYCAVPLEPGPERAIPTANGELRGSETAPNRRGARLACLDGGSGDLAAGELPDGLSAADCSLLFVADGEPGSALHRPEVIDRLRWAPTLVVMGWAETPLTRVADVVLPCATHAEREGTFVNSQGRLQRFERAFPPPAGARAGLEILLDLLERFQPGWKGLDAASVFERMADRLEIFGGLGFRSLPAEGVALALPAAAAGARE